LQEKAIVGRDLCIFFVLSVKQNISFTTNSQHISNNIGVQPNGLGFSGGKGL
jgi:hypothetical protein